MLDRASRVPSGQAAAELTGRALLATFGTPAGGFELCTLKGDASSRSYHRARLLSGEPRTVVVMQLAADPLKSDELTDWVPPEYPFTLVQRYLEQGGLPVVRILAARPAEGWLVLEDLGDTTLERALGASEPAGWETLYARAVDLLALWQRWGAGSLDASPVAGRCFSRRLMSWELDHYVQWGIEARLGIHLEAGVKERLAKLFDPLLSALGRIPTTLVHRDFQSRNLMVCDRGLGEELVIIDFQDALRGPVVYDAVALLCDSYIEMDERLQSTMVERLRSRAWPGVDRATFTRWFDLQAVQRKLKDAGRFVFIDRVKGNPDFLPFVDRSLGYVRRSMARLPELAGLEKALAELGGLA